MPADSDLRRRQRFLEKGQLLSSMGTFARRIGSDRVEFSDELRRIHEFEPGVPITLGLIATRIHPEDRAILSEKVDICRQSGDTMDYEFRLLMPDGSVKFLHTNAFLTRDANGDLEIIGATQDITSRKLAVSALTASIVHEVSQPLCGMITNAGTCLRHLSANPHNLAAAQETVRRIAFDGKRAAAIIARLRLDYALHRFE